MTDAEIAAVERAIGHRFSEQALLERALTHSTGRREGGSVHGDNEELEFLGDAVLGLVVSQYLMRAYPMWSPGKLSQSKARLVSAASLCVAARRVGLGAFLHLGRGEEKTGGREKETVLADAYEAVVAAIYFDAGFEPAWQFVNRTLLDEVTGQGDTLAQPDHKSALQEFLQARGMRPADYVVVAESGPDHRKLFQVEVRVGGATIATGEGASKKKAEQVAAQAALLQLRARDEAVAG